MHDENKGMWTVMFPMCLTYEKYWTISVMEKMVTSSNEGSLTIVG